MNLTHGKGGKSSCPICYVPKNEQQDLNKTHELHTIKETQTMYNMAMAAPTCKAREAILKPKDIRMIKVCTLSSVGTRMIFCTKHEFWNTFWSVQFSDPHAATAFNHIHNNAHGTGGKHILPELKCHIKDLGGSKMDKIDEQ